MSSNKTKQSKNTMKNKNKESHLTMEFAEELNIEPRLRPNKTGSVSQNTARPVKPKKSKNNK